MAIRILPPLLVSRIAAGEVVERPASVVKELVENSLDAGARRISISVEGAGMERIVVQDDGRGIPAAEVELAFQRHATSKLSSLEDLQDLATLGFRGEALPSMVAVAEVTVITRAEGEAAGSYLAYRAGELRERRSVGSPRGTRVVVEHLFHSTPARQKFLRSPGTEAGHIADVVLRSAMAHPRVAFVLEMEGRERFRTPGEAGLLDVLRQAYGLEVARELLPLGLERGGMQVSGYASPPTLHRGDSRSITLLVNGRWVQDRSLVFAVSQAYHTLLPKGRYPLAVVILELPPALVDVNVHPAKREVRLSRPAEAFSLIQAAIRGALSREAPRRVAARAAPPGAGRQGLEREGEPRRTGPRVAEWEGLPLDGQPARGALPPLRLLGQVAQTYIVAEGPDGLYLVDQHAAHERILYERLWKRDGQEPSSQRLLEALVFEATPQEAARLEEAAGALGGMGFEIEPFGRQAFRLRSLPAGLPPGRAAEALRAYLGESGQAEEWQERAVVSLICHSAVRAGDLLGWEEMESLLRQLEGCSLPYSCPHGRPTVVALEAHELARRFHRT